MTYSIRTRAFFTTPAARGRRRETWSVYAATYADGQYEVVTRRSVLTVAVIKATTEPEAIAAFNAACQSCRDRGLMPA